VLGHNVNSKSSRYRPWRRQMKHNPARARLRNSYLSLEDPKIWDTGSLTLVRSLWTVQSPSLVPCFGLLEFAGFGLGPSGTRTPFALRVVMPPDTREKQQWTALGPDSKRRVFASTAPPSKRVASSTGREVRATHVCGAVDLQIGIDNLRSTSLELGIALTYLAA